MRKETKEKLEKEKKVIYISEIEYMNKKYAKTMKMQKNNAEYIYYEIRNEEILEIEDEKIVQSLKKDMKLMNPL